MIKKFSLILTSLLFSFLLIEILLIFFFPQNLTGSFRTYGKNGLLLNAKNKKDVPIFHLGREVANYNFGEFHNRKYDLKEVDNKILILGDSFTFGWLLEDKDNFVYKLDKEINDFSLINSAAGGWGTSDQLRYLMNFCRIINPKYTVLFMNTFDFDRSILSNLFFLEKNSIKEGNNKTSKLKIFLENSKIYNFSIENFHIVNLIKKNYLMNTSFNFNYNKQIVVKDDKKIVVKDDKQSKFIKKLFLKFKDEAKSCNTKLIIVNLGWYDYNVSSSDAPTFLKDNISFFNKNFNFIDLNYDMTEIHKNYKKFSILNDQHPNQLGNDFIFNVIYGKLHPLIY